MSVDSINPGLRPSPSDVLSAGTPESTMHPGRRVEIISTISAAALFLCLTVFLQWLSGTYTAGFSGPDEPAHYVTGLMVHDYLHHWPPPPPMQFAEDFYAHYPEVSLGHWPPLFYAIEGGWMSLTSSSRSSVLALMAVLTTLLAFTTYRFIRIEFGNAVGLAAGAFVICIPLVQQYSAQVMAEVPVALFCLWAALAFGRYLETGNWRFSACFGVFASVAILTKGTGFAVLLVVLALLPLRRLSWLARPSFWIAPAIVIGLCGFWYRATLNMVTNGWEEKPGWEFMHVAMPWNLWHLSQVLGWVLLPLVIIGVAVKLVPPKAAEARWTALAMLIFGVWLFLSCVPASLDNRHLLTAAAPLTMFLIAGAAWLVSHLPARRFSLRTRALAVAAIISGLFFGTTFHISKFSPGPFHQVASDLLTRPELRDAVFLVSSQNYGEGRFIAEMAMRESRPGHIILRGSKMLARGDWFGLENNLVYSSTDQTMSFLDGVPVTILVLHQGGEGKPHPDYLQLLDVIQQNPALWECIGTYSERDAATGVTEEVRVYQYKSRAGPRVGKIRIDLTRMLGRVIER